ncbi:Na+/H+ antiporter NhaC family protein [Bacillus piscicola]|uniref:Na+/H+ antiporter NhaC family protein n=1 Tax=Bacillus piscicola TaxID=1632684 RepID=UPI001F09B444|nr:Na+/H+ antiporter NhaC family protein [Bacillus piscicola]
MVGETYGLLSLLPIAVVVITAIITKRVIEPLIVGTIVGAILLYGFSFFPNWVGDLLATMSDPDVVWTMVIPALFGILIAMFGNSNAGTAFREIAIKYVRTKQNSLFATYIFGIIIFMDEYMNALLIGGTMRNLTDKFKVPREVLAYVTNSTGTPVSVLLPFSSWAVFLMGLYGSSELLEGDGFSTYVSSIPFMVYPIVMLIIVLLFIFNKVPMTKYVKEATARAEKGELFPDRSHADSEGFEEELEQNQANSKKPRLINFILPIIMLVAGTIVFDMDLIIGVIIAIATCFILYRVNGTMTYSELFETSVKGVQDMVELIVLIIAIFLLVRVNEDLGTIEFVIHSVEPLITPLLLPGITLLVVAFLGFTTGNYWGTMGIVLPIILPLTQLSDVSVPLVLGAMVSGGVFGSQVCFFGDAVTLTSASTQVDNMSQIKVSFPYALFGLLLSFFIFLGLGLIM